MRAFLIRLLIAVVAVWLIFLLLPPVLRVFGLALTPDIFLILRVVIGALGLYYVVFGPPPSVP